MLNPQSILALYSESKTDVSKDTKYATIIRFDGLNGITGDIIDNRSLEVKTTKTAHDEIDAIVTAKYESAASRSDYSSHVDRKESVVTKLSLDRTAKGYRFPSKRPFIIVVGAHRIESTPSSISTSVMVNKLGLPAKVNVSEFDMQDSEVKRLVDAASSTKALIMYSNIKSVYDQITTRN
jgi:hypothetical protein